ncbi:MAG: LuxR family transcriptional regulator [Sphaerochaeta sp.]
MRHQLTLLYHNTFEREFLISRITKCRGVDYTLAPVIDNRFECDGDVLVGVCRDLPSALIMRNRASGIPLLIFAPPNLAPVFTYLNDWRCYTLAVNSPTARIDEVIHHLLQPSDGIIEVSEPIHLTKRESQVLSLVLSGQGTAQIAQSLGIANATVTTYKKSLYQKSGTRSLSQLLLWAMVRQL